MFLFYDWPLLHVCNLHENVAFSTLILGSVFNDYVVFYGDRPTALLTAESAPMVATTLKFYSPGVATIQLVFAIVAVLGF